MDKIDTITLGELRELHNKLFTDATLREGLAKLRVFADKHGLTGKKAKEVATIARKIYSIN